jgi:hypothetical protein
VRSYVPSEFVSKLSAGELPGPTRVEIVGLVKSDDNVSSVVHFSNSPSCEEWLTLPIEIVESVDHLQAVNCKDHQHPLVKVKLKPPKDGCQDVTFFLNILSKMQTSLRRALSSVGAATTARTAISSEHCTDCLYVDTSEGLQVCCWCPGNEIVCTGIV